MKECILVYIITLLQMWDTPVDAHTLYRKLNPCHLEIVENFLKNFLGNDSAVFLGQCPCCAHNLLQKSSHWIVHSKFMVTFLLNFIALT